MFLLLVIIGIASYYGYNLFTQQRDFQLKQTCQDEAVKYVQNRQALFDKQVELKLSNDTNYVALSHDTYNKGLNTCLVLYTWTTTPDPVKYPSLGTTVYYNVDDVLTGKGIDMWWVSFKPKTYNENSSGGTIRGKDTNNRNDFNHELNLLFGDIIGKYGYIQPPSTPIPTSTNSVTPTNIPTSTSASNPYAKMPSWCRDTINSYNAAYQPLNYSQSAINEIIKKANPECATY